MNTTGNIASILGLILAITALFTETTHYVISALGIFLFSIVAMVFWIQRNSAKHYNIAQKKSQDIHYEIIRDYKKYEHYNLDKSILELSIVCQEIAKMLSNVRHCDVSVCIKYTNKKNDTYYVKTLCRDPKSYYARKEKYDSQKLDTIDRNTDFKEIFEKIDEKKDWKEVFFFANYLPQKHQYENTHLDSRKLPDYPLSHFSRNKKWPLCYKSTIVVPILSDGNKDIYGYLCVDSPHNRGFNKKHDICLMQDLALFLAPTIRLVCERHLKTYHNDENSDKCRKKKAELEECSVEV